MGYCVKSLKSTSEEFIPHEAGSPFRWIEPEIAQYPRSTKITSVLARGGPVPIRSSHYAGVGLVGVASSVGRAGVGGNGLVHVRRPSLTTPLLKPRIMNSTCFGAWGSGFGVWDLGFGSRVWG